MTASRPFCASEHTATIEIDIDGWVVECRACKTIGPIDKTKALAEQQWNNRRLYPATGTELRRYG